MAFARPMVHLAVSRAAKDSSVCEIQEVHQETTPRWQGDLQAGFKSPPKEREERRMMRITIGRCLMSRFPAAFRDAMNHSDFRAFFSQAVEKAGKRGLT